MDTRECDLVIVGGGPAGLSAAIAASSEGLTTIMIESKPRLGGQARKSNSIENYMGFPNGITGESLMDLAAHQVTRFGTNICCPSHATSLHQLEDGRLSVATDDELLTAHAVILALGLSYRKLSAKGVSNYVGRGVYYGAPPRNLLPRNHDNVYLIGGANSAGQAALELAHHRHNKVNMVIRKDGIRESMSHYLCERIKHEPNITLITETEVIEVDGAERLESIVLKQADGSIKSVPASELYIFVGASPKTFWLNGSVAMDKNNFILTDENTEDRWKLARRPLLLETSMPGVFAAGDVRHGSVKRVASAVGEGAMALQMVHRYLALVAKNENK